MRLFIALFTTLFFYSPARAQLLSYTDSVELYRRNYVDSHEVVKGADKVFFRFYKPEKKYRVQAAFQKINDTGGFIMRTSGPRKSRYFRYGTLYFRINNKDLKLTIYQAERLMSDSIYKNYLFLPFTDLGSGKKSYGGGRYLDFSTTDIINDQLIIDFNKAYNPYCAYAHGYSCPVPPPENDLPVMIEAGEMDFQKKH